MKGDHIMAKVTQNITIEKAQIFKRNFSGKEIPPYNPEGKRNFCVFISKELAESLKSDGWNVKFLKAREEGDEERAYLPVAVTFDYMPPKIVFVTSKNKSVMGEDDISMLDYAELENVDLIIRPYNYDFNGKQGVKAYLKSGYFTHSEDDLDKKYADLYDEEELPFQDN